MIPGGCAESEGAGCKVRPHCRQTVALSALLAPHCVQNIPFLHYMSLLLTAKSSHWLCNLEGSPCDQPINLHNIRFVRTKSASPRWLADHGIGDHSEVRLRVNGGAATSEFKGISILLPGGQSRVDQSTGSQIGKPAGKAGLRV